MAAARGLPPRPTRPGRSESYDRRSVNIEDLAAELFARPPNEFTSRRNQKAKELKASGRADLASRLTALKKPSLPVWAVNQLAARDRAALGELRQAAQAVVKVQATAAAGRPNAARDLRTASEAFQRKIESVGDAAAAALRESGHPIGQEALRRIQEILRVAALQGDDTWHYLERGALTSELRPGDDVLEMFGAGGGLATGKQAEEAKARQAAEQAQRTARADAEQAKRAAATAERLRQEAVDMAAAAERAAQRAKAAEEEAARAEAQAEKSQRATRPP